MIKEFIPTNESDDSSNELSILQTLKNGELNKALKLCKKNNVPIEKYSVQFMEGVNKLIRSHRTGELLSFIYSNPNIVEVDKIEILKKTFINGDYHGFLKNCFRFKIYSQLKDMVDLAITKVRQEEAIAWRKKFNSVN